MKNVNSAVYENFDKFMTPSSILELMDEEGVDFAVFLAEIAHLTTCVAKSEFIAEFCIKAKG